MKTKILILLIATFFATTTTVSAKIKVPVCFPCETIQTTLDLTADEELKKMTGKKINLAYMHNEYGLLWISVWNTNGRFVLSDTSNRTYWEIDETVANYLKDKHNFDIETAENPLSFWKRIGGKIVLVLVIGLLIWGNIDSKKEDDIKLTND